ncbi:hypothetical protein SAMN05216353_110108 [Halobacillus alkaliphilus]|uniref:Uncharacterized protein n=1 Tax=Halobacillus alkaliphilus TaxID=396056 RepID=A0A1I2LX89_9BACI|nr:hypothetical protein SAMN05216353_110108 [Halobacillus alkaliphilus]
MGPLLYEAGAGGEITRFPMALHDVGPESEPLPAGPNSLTKYLETESYSNGSLYLKDYFLNIAEDITLIMIPYLFVKSFIK